MIFYSLNNKIGRELFYLAVSTNRDLKTTDDILMYMPLPIDDKLNPSCRLKLKKNNQNKGTQGFKPTN